MPGERPTERDVRLTALRYTYELARPVFCNDEVIRRLTQEAVDHHYRLLERWAEEAVLYGMDFGHPVGDASASVLLRRGDRPEPDGRPWVFYVNPFPA